MLDRVKEVPLRGIAWSCWGRVFSSRILYREEKTLSRTEYTLKRKRKWMPRLSPSCLTSCFADALSQVTTVEEAVNFTRRSRASTRVSVPRCHTPPAPAAEPFSATSSDTDYAGRLEVATAALGVLDRVA